MVVRQRSSYRRKEADADGVPIAPLSLGVEERETLEGWARRPKSAQALAQRARIVLECASGSPNTAVADKLGVTYQTVGKWRQRFLERRLAGLLDEPRPGAPRQVGDAQIERVQSARDAIDSALRSHFESCLDYVKRRAVGGGALKGVERGRCARAARQPPRANRSEQFQHRFIVATSGAAISAGRDRDLSPPRGPASFPISSRASRCPGPRIARNSSRGPPPPDRSILLHSFGARCLSEA
jgi:transposase-like protein